MTTDKDKDKKKTEYQHYGKDETAEKQAVPEMKHLSEQHELEHNYHAPDKSGEGERPRLSDEEAAKAGTATGKPSRGVDAYGPGPAQVPFDKLQSRRG